MHVADFWHPRSKYHARRTVVDGISFASKREAARWAELRLLEAAGAIDTLRRQVVYQLHVSGVVVSRYIADFVYRELPSGAAVVEDCKGYRTALYKLKKRMFEAEYRCPIRET